MGRIVIEVNGTHAEETAEVLEQLIKDFITREKISDINIYMEKELKTFPLAEWKQQRIQECKKGMYGGRQIHSTLRNSRQQ